MIAHRFGPLSILPAILLLMCTAAPAQRGGGQPGGSSGTGGSTAAGRANSAGAGQQQENQSAIFIRGRVVMADGSPLPRDVEVRRICGTMNRRETYADAAGNFSFEIGSSAAPAMQDASTRGGFDPRSSASQPRSRMDLSADISISSTNLFDCELRAQASGYRSTSIELISFSGEESPDVGTIVLENLEKVPGTTISVTTAAAPRQAQKAFQQGLDAEQKAKVQEARRKFEEATQAYPKFAEAWIELGGLLEQENDIDGAESAYHKAVNAEPKFVTPYLRLAGIATQERKWDDSLRFSQQVIALDPIDVPAGYLINSIANFNLGQYESAESSARKAYRLDPRHRLPEIQMVLGRILLAKKDYVGALENFKDYLQRSPNAADAADLRQRMAAIQEASGTAETMIVPPK